METSLAMHRDQETNKTPTQKEKCKASFTDTCKQQELNNRSISTRASCMNFPPHEKWTTTNKRNQRTILSTILGSILIIFVILGGWNCPINNGDFDQNSELNLRNTDDVEDPAAIPINTILGRNMNISDKNGCHLDETLPDIKWSCGQSVQIQTTLLPQSDCAIFTPTRDVKPFPWESGHRRNVKTNIYSNSSDQNRSQTTLYEFHNIMRRKIKIYSFKKNDYNMGKSVQQDLQDLNSFSHNARFRTKKVLVQFPCGTEKNTQDEHRKKISWSRLNVVKGLPFYTKPVGTITRPSCRCSLASAVRILSGGSINKLPPPSRGRIPIDGKYPTETAKKYYNNPKVRKYACGVNEFPD